MERDNENKPTDRDLRVLEASKEKLKRDTEHAITTFFDSVLDLAEVAIESSRYKIFRSKVLRLGNDSIREVKKMLDKNYQVLYVPSNEDVIETNNPSVKPRKMS